MELSKSALRVMNQLWEKGELPAKTLCGLLHEQCGWNKNTTYTILNSCVKKGLIERREPASSAVPWWAGRRCAPRSWGTWWTACSRAPPPCCFPPWWAAAP